MSSPVGLRALFERAQGLTLAQREALYRAEGIDAALAARAEALLAAATDPDANASMDEDAIAQRVRGAAAAALRGALPERIGPWRVLGLVGEGGMGVVLLGERDDGEYDRRVALKLVRGYVSERVRERFRRERQLLAALEHPHIAGLIDGGTTEAGEPWLAMPFVEGKQLREWLRGERPPSLRERLTLFATLCRAVHHAHQRLIVHRDLKPSNVMVRTDGSPVLLDFGIAKLIDDTEGGETQTRALTPRYASPEQLLGLPVTTATDVYGLGLLLYEMLAGEVPERGEGVRAASTELPAASAAALSNAAGPWRADAPRLRGDLDRIVHRAVRTDPSARYPSALALAEDIDAWLEGRPVQAAGRHRLYLLRRFIGRHRLGVAAVAVAVLAVGSMSLQWKLQRDRALEAEAAARREAAAAQGVTEFLEGLFDELDPGLHGGRELSARALLALGRERIPAADTAGVELRARLQSSIGRIYAHAGETDTAIALLSEADGVLQRSADAPTRMAARKALANALNVAGRHAEANPLAVALAEDALAQDPPDRMMAAHAGTEIGISAEQLGRRDEAMAAFARSEVLFTAEDAQGELGSMIHNRAWLLERSGDYIAALAGYEDAVARKIAVFGPEHPQVEPSQYGRAKMLSLLGRYREAADVMLQTLPIVEKVSGERSAPMSFTLSMLGSIHLDLGEYAQAEAFYRRGLAVDRAMAGAEPSSAVASGLNSLAAVLDERGEVDAAEALFQESLALRRAINPTGHASIAAPLQNLARQALDSGRLAPAAAYCTEALTIRTAALGEAHPQTLASRLLCASIDARAGRIEAATAAIDAVRDAMAELPEPPKPQRLALLQAQAALAEARGDSEARLQLRRQALALVESLHAEGHPRRARAQLALAEAEAAAGDLGSARARLAEATPLLRAALHPRSPALAQLTALSARLASPQPGNAP
ncbi:MAG: serine/threonine protein kinase [Xanthomonadales bacterium]|nr:serine/threonine protein kinase [Xanthomonadales bacterium]